MRRRGFTTGRASGLSRGGRCLGIGAMLLLAASAGESTPLTTAGPDATVPAAEADAALAADSLLLGLAEGEGLDLAGHRLVAELPAQALVSLSSEFLTVAVASGRLRFEGHKAAGAGQALPLALDGTRIQRLSFDAARLSATLSPGARPLLGEDLERLARRQRRASFWGSYERLRVNARAPGGAASEDLRQSYLAQPAIVRQRRARAEREER